MWTICGAVNSNLSICTRCKLVPSPVLPKNERAKVAPLAFKAFLASTVMMLVLVFDKFVVQVCEPQVTVKILLLLLLLLLLLFLSISYLILKSTHWPLGAGFRAFAAELLVVTLPALFDEQNEPKALVLHAFPPYFGSADALSFAPGLLVLCHESSLKPKAFLIVPIPTEAPF